MFNLFGVVRGACKKEDKIGVYNSTLPDKLCELKRVSEILVKEREDKFISEILWVRVKFGKIFISDRLQHVIVVLNKKGDIERFIGKKGSGPGEIKEIMDFDVDDNGLIYIFDMGNMRFSIFDTAGNFINSFKCGCFWRLVEREVDLSLFVENLFLVLFLTLLNLKNKGRDERRK